MWWLPCNVLLLSYWFGSTTHFSLRNLSRLSFSHLSFLSAASGLGRSELGVEILVLLPENLHGFRHVPYEYHHLQIVGCSRGAFKIKQRMWWLCFHHVGFRMNENWLKNRVPTNGAKLLMHSFRLVMWHAFRFLIKSAQWRKTIGSKRLEVSRQGYFDA